MAGTAPTERFVRDRTRLIGTLFSFFFIINNYRESYTAIRKAITAIKKAIIATRKAIFPKISYYKSGNKQYHRFFQNRYLA